MRTFITYYPLAVIVGLLVWNLILPPAIAEDHWPKGANRTPLDAKPSDSSSDSEIDSYTSQGEHRDAEFMRVSDSILERVKKRGGSVMVISWTHKGNDMYQILRRDADGGWSGGSTPSGFYTAKDRRCTILSFP